MQALTLMVIGVYRRWLSPLKPPCCRYVPTCSGYALEAVATHGAARGLWLAARRILRCHPWGGSGWDPVPPPAGCRCADAHPRATG